MTPFKIVEAEIIKRGERIDALEAENAALKARIAELEADMNTLQVKIAAREEYIEAQEAHIRFLKRACGWNN